MELGENVDFVVDFVWVVGDGEGVGWPGGFLDGDEASAAEDAFVDEAVAASA